jgi:(p)ppGpp synthase/HD superfamily hydrolase
MISEGMTKKNLPSIEQTSALALSLHGEEYFGHLQRVERYLLDFVAMLPEGILSDEDVMVARHVAYLHDAIEDGHATRAELEAVGYDDRVLGRVEGLTRDPAKEVYQEKIEKIAASGDVVLVLDKLADNKDNSTKDRIVSMPPERRSLVRRYRRARTTLHEGYRAILLDVGLSAGRIDLILADMAAFDTGDY